MTIRERIRAIQREMRDGALSPDMAREHLMTLTALIGNVCDELREADHDYKVVLLAAFEKERKANRAQMVAETSDEYVRLREARDTEKLVDQMIVSCRTYLRSLDTEMRLAR